MTFWVQKKGAERIALVWDNIDPPKCKFELQANVLRKLGVYRGHGYMGGKRAVAMKLYDGATIEEFLEDPQCMIKPKSARALLNAMNNAYNNLVENRIRHGNIDFSNIMVYFTSLDGHCDIPNVNFIGYRRSYIARSGSDALKKEACEFYRTAGALIKRLKFDHKAYVGESYEGFFKKQIQDTCK
jgi:hypothetical protein